MGSGLCPGSSTGALSTCSSSGQSWAQDTQQDVEAVFMDWKLKERSQEAYLYPLPKQSKKMYKILLLTYTKNLGSGIITVLCTIVPEDVSMAICTSSGKRVIISTWPGEKLLTKQNWNEKTSVTQTAPTHTDVIKRCPHRGALCFMLRRCAMPSMNTSAI